MSQKISLKEAERKAFRATYNDGLWDILLGCVFLMFVIAPFLSPSLGDYWSSVVFLPFWGLVFLGIRLIRKHVVTPRVGVVNFGLSRKTKLAKFTVVMLAVNYLWYRSRHHDPCRLVRLCPSIARPSCSPRRNPVRGSMRWPIHRLTQNCTR
jgi:hypothetical protein